MGKVIHGKRTDISVIQEWAINLGGQLISTQCGNMLSTLEWECNLGHRFFTTFNHIKNRGQWCPVCGREKANKSMIKRMATQEARDKIRAAHWKRNGISSNEDLIKRNAERKKNRFLHRLKTDINIRLKHNIRQRVRMALAGQIKTLSISKELGCAMSELKQYLESKFQLGMSWDNYGLKGWHIDHIKPLSLFNLSDPEQFKKACHYTNLQPLWAKDNLKKGAKYE